MVAPGGGAQRLRAVAGRASGDGNARELRLGPRQEEQEEGQQITTLPSAEAALLDPAAATQSRRPLRPHWQRCCLVQVLLGRRVPHGRHCVQFLPPCLLLDAALSYGGSCWWG